MTKVVYGLPDSVYHGDEYSDYISSSTIRTAKQNGIPYVLQGKRVEETDEMRLGTAVHARALEPDKFDGLYCRWDDEEVCASIQTADGKPSSRPRATKEYAQKREKFEADNAGKIVFASTPYDIACQAGDIARSYLPKDCETCQTELTVLWERRVRLGRYGMDDEMVKCKARLDFVDADNHVLYDIKTIGDIHAFERSFSDKNYHIQFAFYIEALKALTNQDYTVRVVWVQSDGAKGASQCVPVDDAAIMVGRLEIEDILTDLVAAKRGVEETQKVLPRMPSDYKMKLPTWHRQYGAWK